MQSALPAPSSPRSALRLQLAMIYGALFAFNAGAWIWAFLAFRDRPAVLNVALLIYGLGLRHAVDADHIAAIDNVTRKLLRENQRPLLVGFFFAMGHSAIVTVVTVIVMCIASTLGVFQRLHGISGTVTTLISASFLLAIAAMNVVVFLSILRSYRRLRSSCEYVEEDLDALLDSRGLLARLFRRLFRLVTRSWHMFPLGVLFGLGFDTATEVTLFGIAGAQVASGLPLSSLLVLPVLFAAGMSLIDTTDGVVMVGAYQWAAIKPVRKIYYNLTITLVSVLVGVAIGGIEALGLIGDGFGLTGWFWEQVRYLKDHFNLLGFGIIGLFLAAWIISALIYRYRRIDDTMPAG